MGAAWRPGGLSWKELAKRVWAESLEDDIFGYAAQLSYYFLFAFFPLLLLLTVVFGYFAASGPDMRRDLLHYLGSVMPRSALELVRKTMDEITAAKSSGKLSFGILATLWAASSGVSAICSSLNVAYNVRETRPWWKQRLIAIGLTLALSVLIISALVLLLYGGDLAEWIARSNRLGDAFTTIWKIAQWPIVLLFVFTAYALIYYLGPDVKPRNWKLLTPGAFVGVGLWILVSFGFRLYLRFFDSYTATYGSLGAVIILMLWLYLTGAAILIGGEINSEVGDVRRSHAATHHDSESPHSS